MRFIILHITLILSLLSGHAQPVKVACVGNSVTYGYKLADRSSHAYPAQLQQLLGDNYRVENFGHSGATLLEKGHNPYRALPAFENAVAFEPEIVVIHLGLNDTDPSNWPKYRDQFTTDYIDLIRTFRQLKPDTKVWICHMTPIFSWHPRFKSSTRVWYDQVQQEIERVAKVTGVPLIDLNTPLFNRPDLFPDALHPTAEGAGIIAKTGYSALTGDFGGLQLPAVFTDHMVMQRNRPVKFRGTANAATRVTVRFEGEKAIVTFSEAKRLHTSDNHEVREAELAGADKIFYPAEVVIIGDHLEMRSEKVPLPAFVRYGLSSYTEGNLVNEAGMPASTFSTEFMTIQQHPTWK